MSQTPIKHTYTSDDGTEMYYMALSASEKSYKGVLVLMPGFSQRAEDVFRDSDLPETAAGAGLLVVTLSTGFHLTCNDETVSRLTEALTDVLIQYKLDQEQFIFGGFSAGGTILLRYAEYCHETPGDYPVIPAGVFTVDSPVDVIAFWEYIDRELHRDFSEVGMNEARHIGNMLKNKYGTLDSNRVVYEKITPFDISSREPGNERFLLNTAVRVYHDVDINWQLKNRRRSAYDTNFLNSSELIARLMLQGNDRAEFIQSEIKGQRLDGKFHPHSWNIVDGKECVQWMLNTLK